MTPTLGDYNTLARENADLRDELHTLKDNITEEQEHYARAIAEARLSAGISPDEVYEDAYKVLDRLKDRCWNNGCLDGLRAARNSIDTLLYSEQHAIDSERESRSA